MEISDLVSRLRLPEAEAQPRLPPEFRVGQLLQALSRGATVDGLFRLLIGGRELLARSQVPLPPGRVLTLLVERAGIEPLLRLVETPESPALKAEALKQALPKMLELAPAIGRLLRGVEGATGGQLPQETRRALQQVLKALPPFREAMTAEGLRRAIVRSGVFNEAGLVRDGRPVQDLKTALQRVAVRLRSEPPPAPHRSAGAQGVSRGEGRPTPAAQSSGSKPGAPPPAKAAAGAPLRSGPPAVPTAQNPPGAPSPPAAVAGRGPAAQAPPPEGPPGPQPARSSDMPAKPLAAGEGQKQSVPPSRSGPLPRIAVETTAAAPPSSRPAPGPPAAAGRPVVILPPTSNAPAAVTVGTEGRLPADIAGAIVRPTPRPQRGSAPPARTAAPQTEVLRLGQELARQVEGAVARIQYNQLSSLPQEDPSRQAWQLDLPLRDGERFDTFQLRIEKEEKRKQGGKAGYWTVTLSFDLAPLGPVHTRIGLQGETVSGTFWAERAETAGLINRRLDELRAGFERAGLEVGTLSAHRGPAPCAPAPHASGALLDDNA